MKKFDLIIKNGLVILESGEVNTDIAIKNGQVAAIGYELGEAKNVVNAEGLIVSPGMVDVHVHITDPGGCRQNWEGYVTGTKSCAKGGVTTFIEMPLNQLPATVDETSINKKYQAGKDRLYVDVASYGGLVPHNLDGGIQELNSAGVTAYKCFMTACGDPNIEGDFAGADDYTLYEGMKQIAKTGKILAIHAENDAITSSLGKIARARGESTLAQYVATRPVFTEVEAIRRAIYFAKVTGCRIHICHVACPEGVQEVINAKKEGVDVTCETCLHYLYFVTNELDSIGMSAKCSPPIRDLAAKEGLWQHLFSGAILTVVSDHSPCPPDLKNKSNAFDAWGGISGVQNNLDIFFDEAVQKRGLSLKAFADLIARKPAERFNLPSKGSIAIGKDADIVLIRPNSPYVLKSSDLEYLNKFSPYVGRTINSQIVSTYLRGERVYAIDTGVMEKATGQYIYR